MWVKDRKRKTAAGPGRLGIVCMGIVIFFNIAAVGYASWRGEIKIGNVLSTGSIDVVFSGCEVEEIKEREEKEKKEDGDCKKPQDAKHIDVALSSDKKKMDISICDAVPGDTASISYTVTNLGSIPVVCKMDKEITGPVTIDVQSPEGMIDGYGGTGDGVIHITVEEAKEKEEYDFSLDLQFEQYNVLH